MEENKEYLNEEGYQKAEKRLTIIAIFIFLIGLSIGGYLIYMGVAKPGKEKLEALKTELENKKAELEKEGVSYTDFANYSNGKAYEMMIITRALDPSFDYCDFDEYKNNSITKDYCKLKNRMSDYTSTSFIMIGSFISVATCMIGGFVLFIAKQRKIAAFSIQQSMPVTKEAMEKMAPSVGKSGGIIAKEIVKGIKEGMDSDED